MPSSTLGYIVFVFLAQSLFIYTCQLRLLLVFQSHFLYYITVLRLRVGDTADIISITHDRVCHILTQGLLDMKKRYARWVSHMLSSDQKAIVEG